MVKTLSVYKASAGSGKTFTLAVEYIKLLVQNPSSYRNILAVTFTNKATEEMKMRILSQLYGIWKQLPDSDKYLNRVQEDTQLDEKVIRQRAGEALHLLLHNYSYFRVETIDSFFQSVLRNLAREMDLTANLRISLNDTQVEEQAVDTLIDSLTHTDVMLQWLLSYIMEKISEDHSWNIIGQVKKFGMTIFRNYYKEHSVVLNSKIQEPGFIDDYIRRLKHAQASAKQQMKQFADDFFDTLKRNHIDPSDLAYGKSGVLGFFNKLSQGNFPKSIVGSRVNDCLADASKWYSNKSPQATHIHDVAETSLMPLLLQALEARPKQWNLMKSAELTLSHLNQLRLLGSIEQKVHDLNEEANRFLLSDTQQLLHGLIDKSDSPFIFEKIGAQLEHIMIDEFQDTSGVQWQNFKVLLQECMSHHGSRNLIVGDVKQSIYRWRGGDWQLLNAIDREFPHPAETLEVVPLSTNYRSQRNVIAFNNAFFTEAAKQESDKLREIFPEGADQLQHAYADVEQLIPDGRPSAGEVSVTLLPQDDYQQQTLQRLLTTIRNLRARDVELKDIAILVRNNKYIPLIADHFSLNAPELPIVSDEAFRLDASVSVTLLIQALRLLVRPDDLLAKATLVKLFQRCVLGNSVAENELLISDQPLDNLLPPAFTNSREELLLLPLYELVERLYDIFCLERLNEQSAYMCAFYDQLAQFTKDHTSGIDAFLREWEETICSKTIQCDMTDGIRILSIHKSKGLEFDHVVIPFCDWRLEMSEVLWCQPDQPPFDELPITPVTYSGTQMQETIYENDYQREHLQNTVDNLNLLYVAFTRAARNLYVFGQRNAKGNRSVLLESVLTQLHLDGAILEGTDDSDSPLTFSYGFFAPSRQPSEHEQASDNVFLKPVTPCHIGITTFSMKTSFRQSNKSREFIEGDDQQSVNYIKMGSVLHEVFSTIRTTADIEGVLQRMQFDGVLYDDEVTRERLVSMLHQRLEDSQVRAWFSDHWQLFNECSILQMTDDGQVLTRRPDRVITDGRETHVIDFKFGRQQDDHIEQVREYMQLLRQMSMPHVRGWLWYVYSNRIIEVSEWHDEEFS